MSLHCSLNGSSNHLNVYILKRAKAAKQYEDINRSHSGNHRSCHCATALDTRNLASRRTEKERRTAEIQRFVIYRFYSSVIYEKLIDLVLQAVDQDASENIQTTNEVREYW